MAHRMTGKQGKGKGFSLIEVLIGVFLVAVAVLGLIQLFMMGIMNNARASEIANAVFLAQQEIDSLRTMTRDELSAMPPINDEMIDVNVDGKPDYRRITVVSFQDPQFSVRVLVFGPAQASANQSDLIADPEGRKVRARMETQIGR
ncbi:MAG: type IV pilus modification PilV family protein [Candidatus Aminicenantales bacterium]